MKGIWISLDGCGGSGKTTFFEQLKDIFPKFVYVPEFSSNYTGNTLKKAIQECGPYINSQSCVGSSLLFLSDYFTLCESIIIPNLNKGRVVVSDRGFLSKIAVQDVIMSQEYRADIVETVLTSLFRLSPLPDYSLNFDFPLSVIRERLIKRDGVLRNEHERLIILTKKKINHYANIFNVKMLHLSNESDVDKAVLFINGITCYA